jgi:gliding motility-associated-like protein
MLFSQEITHKHSIHHAFIENKGQWHPSVLFKSNIQGGNLWIQQRKFVFHLQDFSAMRAAHANPTKAHAAINIPQTVVHLNFEGANEVNQIERLHPTDNYYNYFIGNDRSKWASDVRGYGEAVLHEFYTGIDLMLIEQNEQLKYEFRVQPQADVSKIAFNYSGHKALKIDAKGNLVVKTDLGDIIEQKPYSYQIINGKIIEVSCAFALRNGTVTFQLGAYDNSIPLVIDPVLIFATYSGSVTDNFGMTATYGYDGTAYSGGMIYGNAYPTPDNAAFNINSTFTVPANAEPGITDAFISKYAANGSTMLWTTFLGGGSATQGTETAQSMICDKANNLYIYGSTSSTDFPIVGGYQATHAGGLPNANFEFNGVFFTNQGTDIYVAKISANGHNLLASTYIGGSGNDGVNSKVTSGTYNTVAAYDSLTSNYGDQFRGEIMLDPAGNCLVASCSRSLNFPVLNAFQPTNAGMQDGVIFKLSSNLSTLLWSSYYGGNNNDACYSVKVDSSLNIVFGGGTSSTNLPNTAGGWQATYNGGKSDGFIAKLTPNGATLTAATYIGTGQYDQVFFVDIDRNNTVFAVGQSAGGTFPLVNAGYSNPNSSQFIIKLSPSLSTNLASTVIGNGGAEPNISPAAFLVDVCGNIYVSGWGANLFQSLPLSGMPVTPTAFQATAPNGFDFYLFVLERSFNSLLYASYIGGNQAKEHVDGGTSRFDKNGVVYQSVCGGCAGYSDFPTTPNAWSNQNLSMNCNNLLFKFDFQLTPTAQFTANQTSGCAPFSVLLTNTSSASDTYLWNFGNGNTSSTIFNPTVSYSLPGTYDIYLYVTDSVCLLTDTAKTTITVYPAIQLSLPADSNLCSPIPLTIPALTNNTATTFIWSTSPLFADTLNTDLSDSVLHITPSSSVTYYVWAGNANCHKIDSIHFEFISSSISLSGDTLLCKDEQSLITVNNSNPLVSFTYTWSPSAIILSQPTNTSVVILPGASQYLHITAASSNGCLVKDSVFVGVSTFNASSVTASASQYTAPIGSTVTLSGQPAGMSYQWSPTVGVAQPTQQTTTAVMGNETATYTLTVSDDFCSKSASVTIKVYAFICGESYIYVPTAFTPNGDNENDVLYVRGKMIDGMLFRVFDRWGEMVFESTDRTIGWDGTFRGKKLNPDVYDFYLKATCIDGNETMIKWNVTLMQ